MSKNTEMGGALAALDNRLAEIGGCGNRICLVVTPRMGTNAGCSCWRDAMKMQRVLLAYQSFRAALSQQQGDQP